MVEIVKTQIGVMTYLAPTGPFMDSESVALLNTTVDTCLEEHRVNLILDMSKIPTITGGVLETLIDIQDRLARIGGNLRVVNPNALLRDIFKISGFEDHVAVLEESL